MIVFDLHCEHGHRFEGWFGSSDDYESQLARGLVECPECGSAKVAKSLMAPKVQGTKKSKGLTPNPAPSSPDQVRETALAELRKQVEENSEYVGMNFATEARAIHDGDAPERSIYGEARPAEAKSLIEDGVPVAPLPFAPKRKMN